MAGDGPVLQKQEKQMLGVYYLIICILIGKELTDFASLFSGAEIQGVTKKKINLCWAKWPAALGTGILTVTWMVYGIAWIAHVVFQREQPLFWGNLLVLVPLGAVLCFLYRRRLRRGWKPAKEDMAARKYIRREGVFFFLLMMFLVWIMFYVFHMKDNILYSGFTVYGDYAPHTAMIRSFSMENNYPTQYPHYGGQDVKYHFMFQFLTGNLEYLGIRLDFAYNLISVLVLLGFFMLLYSLAVRLTGSRMTGVGAILLFFFRSGLTFFRFAAEHIQAGDLWETLKENASFIGYTPNENWGLCNFNVYLNQRHLALGLLMVCLAIWVYLDWVEAGNCHRETGLLWIRGRLFSAEAWKCREPGKALATGVLLGLCSFWNGAAVIGGLLILMGFAVFSDGKLDYVLTAAAAVVFTLLQTSFFIRGSSTSLSFFWGFLAENKSIAGVLWYLIQMSGFFFLGLAVLVLFMKRSERMVLLGFVMPLIFAFTISLTPDINVNHKYIMIAQAFLNMIWADAVRKLWKKNVAGKLAVPVLVICLTATGIYDFAVILKANAPGRRVAVRMDSTLTKWITEHLDSMDLILTPEYSMNEVTMSGAMLYCGWPYYAWSAGYDTNYRAGVAVEIYTSDSPERVKELVEQEGITYLLYEENMTFEENICREDVIAALYPLVYTSDDERIRIYGAGEVSAF